MIDTPVFVLVLLSALMSAAWNGLVKIRAERLQAMGITTLVASVLSLPAIVVLGVPPAESWWWLVLSVAVHTAYHFALGMAYRHGDLGQVFPIARGSAPLLVMAGAAVLAGEWPNAWQAAGVAVLCIGVLGLAFLPGVGGIRRGPLAYSLLTGVLVAAYTVADGLGARHSQAPLAYAAAMTVGGGLLTALVLLAWKGPATFRASRETWKACSMAATFQLGATWIAIWALSRAPLAAVSALRETSVLWVALFSTFLLKEGFGKRRVGSTALVLIGLLVMRLS